jgi:hypothetical protein
MLSRPLASLLSLSTLTLVLAIHQSAKAITRIGNSQSVQEQVHQDVFQASRGVTFPYQNSSHQPYVLSIANKERAAQKITITAGSAPRANMTVSFREMPIWDNQLIAITLNFLTKVSLV